MNGYSKFTFPRPWSVMILDLEERRQIYYIKDGK